jgi:uncharacterized protein
MDFLYQWGWQLWLMLLESGVWLIVGFGLAGVVHTLMPMQWIKRQLGSGGFWAVFKAAMLGIPLPLCSCSVIPMAASIRREGASKGATASFTISTPETGAETIALTWGILGPVIALARPIAALATAMAAGVCINAIDDEDTQASASKTESESELEDCCSSKKATSCCAQEPEVVSSDCASLDEHADCCATESVSQHSSFMSKVVESLRWGYVRIPVDISVWLVIGLVLSAFIAAVVPEGWIASHVGTGIVPKLAMLIVGLPLYVCAAASTPVAASLVLKGLTPGAAMVFLLAGPATNTATMSWMLKGLGAKALAVYLIVIALFSILVGVAIDWLWPGLVIPFSQQAGHTASEHGASLWSTIAAVLLSMMLVMGVVGWVKGKIKSR